MNFYNGGDSVRKLIVSNREHESGINYSLRYTRLLLRVIGIWPLVAPNPTTIDKNIGKITLPINSILMMLLSIPVVSHIIIRGTNRSELIALLAPLIFEAANMMKHYIMILRADALKLCMLHIERDWGKIENPNERDIMMRSARVQHGLTTICLVYLYSSYTLHNLVMPLTASNVINEFNETVRPLLYPGIDIFIDVGAKYVYEIVFCSNLVSGFVYYTVVTAVCNLSIVFVSHACGQVDIVISRLERLVVGPNRVVGSDETLSIENQVSTIIQTHVNLIKFATNIELALRDIYFVEVVSETAIISIIEYDCIAEWSKSDGVSIFTHGLLLVTFSLNLLVFCEVGEVLKEQCQKVGEAAYMIEWYELPKKANLALMMIISMSAHVRSITAGGMVELSRITFASIMKTSFAYLNILRTTA